MAGGLHHPVTPQPRLGAYIGGAMVGHVLLLVIISLAITQSVRTAPAQVIQVRIVGVPAPAQPKQKKVEPEEIRTQDSAAPKEPPPDAKSIPPSEAKSRFVTEPQKEVAKDDKVNPIDAKERPPVLDKTPQKKKIVKNDLKAKVVKNPEDFMAALDFIDKLETKDLTPSPTVNAKPTEDPAGEGPQIQLNLSQQGQVDALRAHIMKYWTALPGQDTNGLAVVVRVRTSSDGNLTAYPQVITSSGNPAFDDSLVRAVRKAVPLPLAPGDDAFRVLDFTFGGQ